MSIHLTGVSGQYPYVPMTTMLEPSMTFHFMPGLWMDEWGIETTETILITDKSRPYMFTNLPREMTVKP